MPATGNEPVKLSQLKSIVPGFALRKFNFTTTNANAPAQLPFAPDWGINIDDPGSYTAVFMDYGNTVQLLSLLSLVEKSIQMWIFYTGNAEAMNEKLANESASKEYTVTRYDTNTKKFYSNRSLINDYNRSPGYSSLLQLVNKTTISVNSPFLFFNLFFEK